MRPATLRFALLCAAVFAISSACANIVGDFQFGTDTTSSQGGGGTSSSSSSSSGHGGTAGHGGTGGMCATMACTMPSDCPATGNECVDATCDMGCCGTKSKADGTAIATQTAGNCAKEVCMGGQPNGSQPDDTDVPADQDDCHTGACDASHMPVQKVKPTDTTCASNGGKVCGDTTGANAGKCVQCNVDGQCTAPKVCDPVNKSGVCVDPGCTDGLQDGTETDKDCGGSCGATCADGKLCMVDGDCMNGFCNQTSHTCATPTCTDTIKNGAETDKDCGGALCDGQGKTCADGLKCSVNADCTHGYCKAGVCTMPTCGDGVKNGNETDIDCGGGPFAGNPACSKCAVTKGCAANADCQTNVCNGGTCDFIPQGQLCTQNAFCASNACVDGVCCNNACTGTCQACTAAKKGSGSDGVCGPIKVGTDPDNECNATPASTCGNNGSCDGAGACQKWAMGTTCVAATCANATTLNNAQTCDGAGTCSLATTTSCGNYTCKTGACLTTCATDTDCAPTAFCNAGACVPKLTNAATCTGPNQCASGNCVDGVCCGSACTPTCQSCAVSGSLGTCTNIPFGMQDTFPANACTGNGACNGAGTCLLNNGSTCSASSQCLTGFCVDGVCCNTACNGTCQSCNINGSQGTCSNVPFGALDQGTCSSGGHACDGNGLCLLTTNQPCQMGSQCLSGICQNGKCQ
jgi:hypothetical protein